MTYSEDDLLPLSALQHLLFCERQCALIHVEQQWVENLYTAEGRIMHERVDSGRSESRGNVRIASGLPLRSLRLGLGGESRCRGVSSRGRRGRAEPAEFARSGGLSRWSTNAGGPRRSSGTRSSSAPRPCVWKRCWAVEVPKGALFYGKTRRRVDVVFDADLRRETEEAALRFHALIASGVTPLASYDDKCEACSFISLCLPKATTGRRTVARYLAEVMREQERLSIGKGGTD